MKKKEVKRSSALSFTGVLLLILAAVLVGVYFATTDENIQQWYAMYEDLLLKMDLAILSIGDYRACTLCAFRYGLSYCGSVVCKRYRLCYNAYGQV